MPSKTASTTAILVDKLRDLVTVGEINTNALRAVFGPSVSDIQFRMALSRARKMFEHEGFFVKPDRKRPGYLIVATAEDVSVKALETSRLAIVKKSRQRMVLVQDAQKIPTLDDESKTRLQTEELLYGRTLQFIERALLKSQRKRPDGLEP